MALLLQIGEGNQKDLKYLLKEGVRIGRSQGEIQIQDPKVSGLHAVVESDDKGQLILRDLNSANGLTINAQRVKRVILVPGVNFLVGATMVKVLMVPDNEIFNHVVRIGWRHSLRAQLEKLRISSSPPPDLLQALNPTVLLTVTHGPAADQVICLGYAPRQIGRDVLDVELRDPLAPPHAVDINPSKGGTGVALINRAGNQVKINSQPFLSHEIRDGDQLQFGSSIIRINFG